MDVLVIPEIAYLILVVGLLLAILALFAPGTGFIELVAFFMLVLAGYGIYHLPINMWALVLLASPSLTWPSRPIDISMAAKFRSTTAWPRLA